MNKFDGNWKQEMVKDLIELAKNKTHAETALELTKKYGFLFSRDSVKNKVNRIKDFGFDYIAKAESVPPKSREFFDRTENDENKKNKRVYFITSVVAGCELNKPFYQSILQFCKHRKAKLVILPMKGINSKDEEYTKDVLALSEHIYTEYTFNKNIEAFDVMMNPTQVNPLTGLNRIAKKSSVIVSSPKQNCEVIPVSSIGIPHLLHSTGAITEAKYSNNRVGMIATEDHVLGGLVLEIESPQIFHIRQVQADSKGCFYDLNNKYQNNCVKNAKAKAFVVGDLHCGEEDPTAIRAWHEVIKLTKPEDVIFHDVFNSKSISHHLENNINAKANREGVFKFLEDELDNAGEFLTKFTKQHPGTMFYAVASNHDEHLSRYLDEGRYAEDYMNLRVALPLAIDRLDGLNPIEEYMNRNFDIDTQVEWLKRDQDLTIEGIQVAVHGDKGSGGVKGSLANTEKTYNKSITAHLHNPKILYDAWQVGTSTMLKLDYTIGSASNWLHASCLIYPGGQRSMIISIQGKWKI